MVILWDARSISQHMGGIGQACRGWLAQFLRDMPERWRVIVLFSAACEEQTIRLVSCQANVICLVCNARLAISALLAKKILVEPVAMTA